MTVHTVLPTEAEALAIVQAWMRHPPLLALFQDLAHGAWDGDRIANLSTVFEIDGQAWKDFLAFCIGCWRHDGKMHSSEYTGRRVVFVELGEDFEHGRSDFAPDADDNVEVPE